MKMTILASLLVAGCSQDEFNGDGEDNGDGKTRTSYMVVNLVSSGAPGTRATEGNYEDGNAAENLVSNVRFYFFDGAGGAVSVKKKEDGSYVNYFDWKPENPQGKQPGDVEKKLGAVIVISTKDGDRIPQRIAAVINPTTDLGKGLMPLTELKKKVGDYAKNELTTEGKFVMFTATYVDDDGIERCTASIGEKSLATSEEEAKKNPVVIHVERNVAKVSVRFGDDVKAVTSDAGLALKDKDGKELKVGADKEQVYLKIKGWALTAETSEGRLVKHINPGWPGSWWKDPLYKHRTLWAINSKSAENKYNLNYNAIAGDSDFEKELYTNENAGKNDYLPSVVTGNAQKETKVILKGELSKENGDPFIISRHLGAYYAEADDNLELLKKSILNQLQTHGKNYYKKEDDGKKQIGPEDLEIVIADQTEKENSKNCYVYAKLTEEAATKTWYTSLVESAEPDAKAVTDINEMLKNPEKVDRALVWMNGQTYYYFEIVHNKAVGQKGVVRNHVYKTRVTKIAGLGTPVYDPTKVIYPETPDPNEHYIAAEVDVLSWRIVSNDYELEW